MPPRHVFQIAVYFYRSETYRNHEIEVGFDFGITGKNGKQISGMSPTTMQISE